MSTMTVNARTGSNSLICFKSAIYSSRYQTIHDVFVFVYYSYVKGQTHKLDVMLWLEVSQKALQ